MIKYSDLTKDYYSTGDVARLVGLNYRSIAVEKNKGKIKMSQSSTGRWYATKEDVIAWLDGRMIYLDDSRKERVNAIYARVFSHDQKKNGDLDRQIGRLASAASGKGDFKVFSDTASGLNAGRKGLGRMLDLIGQDRVKTVFVTHKDRLTRFGFEFLERLCKEHGTEICVLETRDEKSAQEELAEDLMSLIASFSGSLDGLRSSRRKELACQAEKLIEGKGETAHEKEENPASVSAGDSL